MMKVALYARVSTSDQNPETQLSVLRRYSEARGWIVVEEYVDQASGATWSRPRLDALMREAASQRFDGVLVWKFDRLFRSVGHMLELLEAFRSRGIEFVSVTECIDTTSAVGKMVFTLLAAIGEFERDLIRERTRAGMDRARREGKRIGRPRVTVDVEKARELWKDGKGLSIRHIAHELRCSATKVWFALREPVSKGLEGDCKHP